MCAERVEDVIEAAIEPATQKSPAMADIAPQGQAGGGGIKNQRINPMH